MKRFAKFTACAALVAAASVVGATPYSATGAGTSTVGSGGEYATLNDALTAVVATGGSGGLRDATTWTFSLISNTSEPNQYWGPSITTGGKIVIKPATTVTVTFTDPPGTAAGTVGTNFAIGTSSDAFPAASTGTNGFEIDGSMTVGGTTRDLTFTHTTPIATNGHAIIAIIGDTDNTVIKNCIINQPSTSANTATTPLSVRPALVSGNSLTPDSWTVENCALTATTSNGSVGINLTSSGTLAVGVACNGFTIRNCDINARLRGIFINPGYGFTLDNNRIVVGTSGTVNGTDTWGVFVNSANSPPANTTTVSNNRLLVRNSSNIATTQGPTGLGLSSMGTGYTKFINVYNNEITIVNAGNRDANTSPNTRGIWFGTSAVTTRVYHNTVYMPDNTFPNSMAVSNVNAFGIGGHSGAGTAFNDDYWGNIIVVQEPNVPAIAQTVNPAGVGSGFTSNYNIIYASNGAFTARRLVSAVQTNYTTLTDYTTAFPTLELNSDQFDPTTAFTSTVITAPDLKIIAGSRSIDDWGVPPGSFAVATDFEGQTRSITNAFRGFDESSPPLAPAAVGDWMILDNQ